MGHHHVHFFSHDLLHMRTRHESHARRVRHNVQNHRNAHDLHLRSWLRSGATVPSTAFGNVRAGCRNKLVYGVLQRLPVGMLAGAEHARLDCYEAIGWHWGLSRYDHRLIVYWRRLQGS